MSSGSGTDGPRMNRGLRCAQTWKKSERDGWREWNGWAEWDESVVQGLGEIRSFGVFCRCRTCRSQSPVSSQWSCVTASSAVIYALKWLCCWGPTINQNVPKSHSGTFVAHDFPSLSPLISCHLSNMYKKRLCGLDSLYGNELSEALEMCEYMYRICYYHYLSPVRAREGFVISDSQQYKLLAVFLILNKAPFLSMITWLTEWTNEREV